MRMGNLLIYSAAAISASGRRRGRAAGRAAYCTSASLSVAAGAGAAARRLHDGHARSDERLVRTMIRSSGVRPGVTAMSSKELSSYSACVVLQIRGETAWVLDVLRERLEYPDLRRKVIELHRRWRKACNRYL